jgi:hypothetical protein
MSPEELRTFVAANDSFGFEMRVCAVLKGTALRDMKHGETYVDPVTGFNRQFDFRFTIRDERRCVLFALECKNIDPSLPVIVCGRKRPAREAFHDVIISQTAASGPRSRIHRQKLSRIYPEDGFVGKSVLKPERDGSGKLKPKSIDAEIHDRWSQAIASSHDLIHQASKIGSSVMSVILPAVVVPDGSLMKVAYDENGEAVTGPDPTDECALFIGHKYEIQPAERHPPVVLSHLHFYTLSGLVKALAGFEQPQLDWDRWIDDDVLASHPA